MSRNSFYTFTVANFMINILFSLFRRKVKQAKEKQLREREQIKRQLEYEKLTVEKKTEIRKKIQEFRKVCRIHH